MLIWSSEALAAHHFKDLYLLTPWVPQGGIMFFHGKRNLGKTQLMLSLVTCITEGGRWLGRYQASQGPVVYVQADMTPGMQQQRVLAAQKLYSLHGIYHLFPKFLNIPILQSTDKLVEEINALHPKLIVWDTLRKTVRGDIVKDDSLSALVYGVAQERFPGVTHCFVHHDKKTVVDEDQLDEEELFSGSGAWLDNADAGIRLASVGSGRLMLQFTKTRTCAPQSSLPLVLNPETLLLYATGEQTKDVADRWRQSHPTGAPQELERYLLASFVGSPRIAHHIAWGSDDSGGTSDERQVSSPDRGSAGRAGGNGRGRLDGVELQSPPGDGPEAPRSPLQGDPLPGGSGNGRSPVPVPGSHLSEQLAEPPFSLSPAAPLFSPEGAAPQRGSLRRRVEGG